MDSDNILQQQNCQQHPTDEIEKNKIKFKGLQHYTISITAYQAEIQFFSRFLQLFNQVII